MRATKSTGSFTALLTAKRARERDAAAASAAALAAAGGGGGSEFAWPTRIDAYELLEPCGTGVRCVRAMGACVGAGGWWWWWCAVCMR